MSSYSMRAARFERVVRGAWFVALVLAPLFVARALAAGRGALASPWDSVAALPRITVPRLALTPLGASEHVALLGSPAGDAVVAGPSARRFELYAPAAPGPRRPLVVMLGGACGAGLPVCERFRRDSRERGWLLCPDGPAECSEGEPDWHGDAATQAAYLERAIAAARRDFGRFIDTDDEVLVGFSRGGFAARDIALAAPGRFRKLVLAGAAVRVDPAEFRRAGIEAVVLASGELDSAHDTMEGAATRLAASGVRARFQSFGPIYHWLPADFGAELDRALAWLAERDRAALANVPHLH